MKGILAILMAGIMMVAMVAPAMGDSATSSATVGTADPVVVSVAVTPDPVTMNPYGSTTPLTVSAVVSDNNGVADITGVSVAIPGITTGSAMSWISNIDATSANYEVVIDLDYCTSADSYTATVTATDANSGTGENTDDFVIDALTAINITAMTFASGAPGDCVAGTHTVTNLGNGGVNFSNLEAASDPAVTSTACPPLNQSGWDGYDDVGTSTDEITWINMAGTGTNTDVIPDANMRIVNVDDPANCLACGGVLNVNFNLYLPNVNSDTYTGTTTFAPNAC